MAGAWLNDRRFHQKRKPILRTPSVISMLCAGNGPWCSWGAGTSATVLLPVAFEDSLG